MFRNLINATWDRWANSHPFLRFLALVTVVATIGLLVVKPGYSVFRRWRSDGNLIAAQKALRDERMDDARELSLAVLKAGGSKIEALRVLEKATDYLEDPMHVDIAFSLISHPQGSDDDRWNGLRGIAQDSPLGVVDHAWSGLDKGLRQQSRFSILFADRLIAENQLDEAVEVLSEVPEQSRSPQLEQRFIRILILSGKKEGYEEAQKRIASHFPREMGEDDEWLDLLERIPVDRLQPAILKPVKEIISTASSGQTARKSLMLARFDCAVDSNSRGAVTEREISRWKLEDPVALAAYLSDLGLYHKLLETLPLDLLQENPSLRAPLLDAMHHTGAWKEIPILLESPGCNLPRFEKLAYQAVVAAKTGDISRKVEMWQAAIVEAKSGRSLNPYLNLREIAIKAGIEEVPEQMMLEAIHVGRGPLPRFTDLMPLLQSLAEKDKEIVIMEICSTYLAFEPDNPVLLTQYAYIASLNNRVDFTAVLTALEPVAKTLPKEMPVQSALATVYLCDNRPEKAAEVLDPLKLDPSDLAPNHRIIFLTTQVLNGRLSKSDPSITDFPWKSLRTSERRKFTELIQTSVPKAFTGP